MTLGNLPGADLPKAELHCHLEGAISPALVRRLAAKNAIALPQSLFTQDGGFAFSDFASFLDAYDLASSCLRSSADYLAATQVYLEACAREGAIYVELFVSPDHAAAVGLGYADQIAGVAQAMAAVERDHGLVARIIVTAVRHFGPQRALAVARAMLDEPHPLVVGFGMAGDEGFGAAADFAPAFALADGAGYGCTVHAGEVLGPDSLRAALASLPVSRLGHGVRLVEDPQLLAEVVLRGIVLEVCPGSNLALGLYPDYARHPFPRLREAGCRVTLNSDDPPFFKTSIGREYEAAARHFGLDRPALLEITRTAIKGAFADSETKARLLARLAAPTEEERP